MMGEADLIARTPSPRTKASLATDVRQLGVTAEMTILVHSSLRSLGWVCGGPVTIIQALMDVVTPSGTIVMPAFCGDYMDPASWQDAPIPRAWWPVVRDAMPAFDPRITPTRDMGRVAELFRTCPDVLRSSHPLRSFTAWGRHAAEIIAGHPLDEPLGEGSPLARIYDLNGWVLLLGVGYDRNTSFHLAEHRAPGAGQIERGGPVMERGQRVWKTYTDRGIGTAFFPQIGSDFEGAGYAKVGQVGSAATKLFRQRDAVDFAVQWFSGRTHLSDR